MSAEVQACWGDGSVCDSGGRESQGGFERWCREFGWARRNLYTFIVDLTLGESVLYF